MTTPVTVASVECVVPSYRLPFLKMVANEPSLKLTSFHGPGKRGHSVVSVGENLPVPSVIIGNLHWPFGGARIAWQTGIGSILRGRYDVVLCHDAINNFSTWTILLCRSLSGYGMILTGHGPRPMPRARWLDNIRLFLRGRLARWADGILVYTEAGAAELRRIGIPDDKIFVSGNTLDTRRLIANAATIRATEAAATKRTAHEQDVKQAFRILFVGRLYPDKRIDLLIETARILERRGKHCHTIIVGDGHQRHELESIARGSKAISFLGAEYDEMQLGRIFETADLLVIPNYVGLAVVHGFCHGVPILTSRSGGTHGPEFDYIEDGVNGLLVDNLSSEAFAVKIAMLMDDELLRKQLVAGALATARALPMETMIDRFLAAVKYVAKKRGRWKS